MEKPAALKLFNYDREQNTDYFQSIRKEDALCFFSSLSLSAKKSWKVTEGTDFCILLIATEGVLMCWNIRVVEVKKSTIVREIKGSLRSNFFQRQCQITRARLVQPFTEVHMAVGFYLIYEVIDRAVKWFVLNSPWRSCGVKFPAQRWMFVALYCSKGNLVFVFLRLWFHKKCLQKRGAEPPGEKCTVFQVCVELPHAHILIEWKSGIREAW